MKTDATQTRYFNLMPLFCITLRNTYKRDSSDHIHQHENTTIVSRHKPEDQIKGALYRIQILCRRYTFWSYPAGLTIADPRGKQKLKYHRVYSQHFHTTIAESIHTTPNSIQCPFKSDKMLHIYGQHYSMEQSHGQLPNLCCLDLHTC